MENMKKTLRDIGSVRRSSLWWVRVPKREGRERGLEVTSEEIMVERCVVLGLIKYTIHILEIPSKSQSG